MLRKYASIFYLLLLLIALSCQNATGPESEADNTQEEEELYAYTYAFKVRIFDDYQYEYPVNILDAGNVKNTTNLRVKSPFDGRSFEVYDSSRHETFLYGAPGTIWEGDDFNTTGMRVEWPSNYEYFKIFLKINETDRSEESILQKTVERGLYNNNIGIITASNITRIDSAAFVIMIPSLLDTNITESIEDYEFLAANGDWAPMLNQGNCLNDIYSGSGEPYPAFIMLTDVPLDTTLTFRIKNKNGLSYEFSRTTGIAPFNSHEVANPARCSDWELLINVIEIQREEIEVEYYTGTQEN